MDQKLFKVKLDVMNSEHEVEKFGNCQLKIFEDQNGERVLEFTKRNFFII